MMNFTPNEILQIFFCIFILGAWISYLIFEGDN